MKRHQRTISTGVVILIGLLFAYFWKGDLNLGKTLENSRSGQASQTEKQKPKVKTSMLKKEAKSVKKRIGERTPVFVEGPNGKEDISATLDRIERGEKFPHRNDGSVFRNREKRLPLEKRGYYNEYVHPTKGRKGPGAQRIVIGSKKETFYTPDHYKTFQEVENVY